MPQQSLQTTRLELRPLSPEHADFFVELNSHVQVTQYVHDGVPLTTDEAQADHQQRLKMTEAASPAGLGYWVGYTTDGEAVGWWSLTPDAKSQGNDARAQLGFRLHPRFWRRGLAKEGSRELLRHAFADLGVSEVYGETMAVNAASRATMASCGLGFQRVFFVEFENPIPGTEEGEVEYSITKQEWFRKQQPLSGYDD